MGRGVIRDKFCCICLDDIENDIFQTNCNHSFHHECLMTWVFHEAHKTCPMCKNENLNLVFYWESEQIKMYDRIALELTHKKELKRWMIIYIVLTLVIKLALALVQYFFPLPSDDYNNFFFWLYEILTDGCIIVFITFFKKKAGKWRLQVNTKKEPSFLKVVLVILFIIFPLAFWTHVYANILKNKYNPKNSEIQLE